ncbi:hypothetical protein [Streptomyces sp. NPDC048665]|uniref:hypothetical protein n=1 Tax=Streptomyces sp. NPDC048665 TaxID=3155490 RepID=UPI0034282CAD
MHRHSTPGSVRSCRPHFGKRLRAAEFAPTGNRHGGLPGERRAGVRHFDHLVGLADGHGAGRVVVAANEGATNPLIATAVSPDRA